MDLRRITDFDAPELDVYARLTENQLLNRADPQNALFVAESPLVIGRALDAGCEPVSFLMETKHVTGKGAALLACRRSPQTTENRAARPFCRAFSSACRAASGWISMPQTLPAAPLPSSRSPSVPQPQPRSSPRPPASRQKSASTIESVLTRNCASGIVMRMRPNKTSSIWAPIKKTGGAACSTPLCLCA